ncbi:AMP-binding protein [Parabacteroides sp. PF5-9]|uniref:AMP-binding protein n=1 Tax=Parabacteroides sp. PF5-9 TaxID=1742404 RepID=UPI002474B741|nr:AMP-binding protein [Parabacteroides sp. PF5-9]
MNTDSDRQLFAIDRHAAFRRELNHFIAEWSNDTPTLTLQTSGSTGQPKQITVRKEQMRQSARQTNDFLGLQPGDTALLCMPLQYIAGKMMVVRALERNLRLIVRQPSGHPLADVDTPVRFAAMVPMQVYNTLQQPDEVERLKAIDILIIGGGFINDELKNRLRDFPNKIYATYGMTETLSHIALRRINGEDRSEYYTPFPGIKLTLSTDHALVIDLPYIDQPLETNDIAELLPDGRFRILGRKDNVINTGGIKVQAEELEAALHLVIDTPYAITSVSDPRLGEAIVLLVENEKTNSPSMDMLYAQICRQIPTHQQPKMIIPVANIPLTATGKIDRKACKNLAFIHSKSSSIR